MSVWLAWHRVGLSFGQQRLRLLLAILLFTLIAGQLPGQQDAAFKVRYLGLKEGLISRDVRDIFQDKRGMVWIATANGLNRYDGRQFKVYSASENSLPKLPSSFIYNVAEDQANNLFICTREGLVVLNSSREDLVHPAELGIPDSVARQPNCQLERLDDGSLLLLCGTVIYQYKDRQLAVWFRLPEGWSAPILRMCYTAKDSTLYLLTMSPEHGLVAIRNKQMEQLNFPVRNMVGKGDEVPFDKLSFSTLNYPGDSLTLIWLTNEGLRLQINRTRKRFEHRIEWMYQLLPPWNAVREYLASADESTLPASMRQVQLRKCFRDDRGIYWMTTNIGVFLVEETRKMPFFQFDALKNQSVRSITEDEEGRLLVGTYDGLFKCDLRKGTSLKMHEIKPVMDMLPIAGNRYWMTIERYNCLGLFDNNTNQMLPFYKGAQTISFARTLFRSGDTVWLSPNTREVYALDLATGRPLLNFALKPYLHAESVILVKTLTRTRDGSVWLASEEGLYRLAPDAHGALVQDTVSLPSKLREIKVNALYEDRAGRLWIGTEGRGVAMREPDGKVHWYTIHEGLAHNVIYSLLGSNGDSLLWVGTQNGLSALNVSLGVFTNYYRQNGLADNEFNSGAYCLAVDGTLYFGGLNGVTGFRPDQLSRIEPPVLKASLFLEIMSNAPETQPGEWFPENGETLPIPPSTAYLEIRFTSSEVFDPQSIRYRYTISGLYDSLQYIDASVKLLLRNLAPGDYRLKVEALSPAGRWSEPFEVTIRMLPRYYQTWWFRGLLVLLVAGLLYGAYRFRIWQIRREYAIRSQIVNDLHDDLGSRLYAMRAIASKIASPEVKSANLPALLEQFDATSKNAHAAMRDFIWAFDPQSDRLENLVDRMADFAENTVRPLVQVLQISHTTLPDMQVAPVVKHHALMIFQELLINAAKHTTSASMEISFALENQQFQVRILNRYEQLRSEAGTSGQKGKESIGTRLNAIKGHLEWKEGNQIQEIVLCIPL